MKNNTSLLYYTMTNGAVLGIVLIIISLLLYIFDVMSGNIFTQMLIGLLSLTVMIVFIVIATKSYRNKILGGTISLKDAFLVGFLIIVFSTVITSFYTLIFNIFIDPDYMDRTYEATKDWIYNWLTNLGAPDSQIDQSIERIERQQARYTPIRTFFTGIIWTAVLGAVIALITGAILKKEPPPFGMEEQQS